MSFFDDLTIQAFMLALPQLDVPLPSEMEQAIHQIGHAIQNQQQQVAASEIRELVTQHHRLNELYQECYDHLQRRYQTHERAKSTGMSSTVTMALPWQSLWAVPILTSDNPRRLVRSIAHHSFAQTDPRIAFDDSGILLASLAKVVRKIDAQETAILRALEYHPLTVEDLTYTVRMSLEQVKTIVESLWQGHYVDVASSNLWQRMLSLIEPCSQKPQVSDPATYFTLTMKGRFRLHPLIKLRDFDNGVE